MLAYLKMYVEQLFASDTLTHQLAPTNSIRVLFMWDYQYVKLVKFEKVRSIFFLNLFQLI